MAIYISMYIAGPGMNPRRHVDTIRSSLGSSSNDWRAAVLLVPRRLSFRKAPCGSPCEEVCASPSLGV